jgi:hypothetical protein
MYDGMELLEEKAKANADERGVVKEQRPKTRWLVFLVVVVLAVNAHPG